MAGIIFFRSKRYELILDFYQNTLGMILWLQQKSCTVLQHDNLLLGFCRCQTPDDAIREETAEALSGSTITFFYPRSEQVDEMYALLQSIAVSAPKLNPEYQIYHFYACDPEGRSIEFQTFLHELKPL
jgi:hypothetical protein